VGGKFQGSYTADFKKHGGFRRKVKNPSSPVIDVSGRRAFVFMDSSERMTAWGGRMRGGGRAKWNR
jgi:hypothetical protein